MEVYKRFILDRGLDVVVHNMPSMRSAALGIWIRVGSRYEEPSNNGVAHFLEHLCFKGTKNYSYRQIKESIEGVGGALNGFTSEEVTCYLAKLPAVHLDLAVDILSDMVINSLLRKVDIEKERTVILEEIKMYKDLPQSYVHQLLDELLWPAHPLGMNITGSIESISSMKRQDILSFKERYYSLPNIVVSAAGFINSQRFVKRISRALGSLGDRGINKFLPVTEKQDTPQLKLMYKDTEQTHIALGFHSFNRTHPLRYALGLLHVILGANMSSRLFNEIREKRGLAYEIGTQVKYFQDTGAFVIHAGVDNRKLLEAIKLILRQLSVVRRDLVGIAEFQRAKEFYLGQLMLALEDTLEHMLWIGESLATQGKIYRLQDIIREVNSFTRKDIRAVASQIFKETKINLAIIGPVRDTQTSILNHLHIE